MISRNCFQLFELLIKVISLLYGHLEKLYEADLLRCLAMLVYYEKGYTSMAYVIGI